MTEENFLQALKEFVKPLKKEEIEWKIQSAKEQQTIIVPYVTSICLQERLDKCFGPHNWRTETKLIEGHPYQALDKYKNEIIKFAQRGFQTTLSILVDGQWIGKTDVADNTDIEPLKGGMSNSLKRAARQWGISRELTNSPTLAIPGKLKFLSEEHKKWASNCFVDSLKTGKFYYKFQTNWYSDFKNNDEWISASIVSINKNLNADEKKRALEKYGVVSFEDMSLEDLDTLREDAIKLNTKLSNAKMKSLIEAFSKIADIDLIVLVDDKFKKDLNEITYRDYFELLKYLKGL